MAKYSKLIGQLQGASSGSGTIKLYADQEEVASINIADIDSSVDFSRQVYDHFSRQNRGNLCARNSAVNLRLAVENYEPSQQGGGFAMQYIMAMDFKDSNPEDQSENDLLAMSITKSPDGRRDPV